MKIRDFAVLFFFLWSTGVASGPEWFSHGLGPVETGIHQRDELFAEDCRSCHQNVYDDWKGSRHQSWTNPVFQEGFLVEPQDRCIFCHSPLREQFREIKESPKSAVPSLLKENGVTCVVCHVRDSEIYSSKSDGMQFHPWKMNPDLKDPKFCAGCHQFNFNETNNGHNVLMPQVVQNTYGEWLAYRSAGGRKTCQNCHMPSGRHTFEGAHTDSVLRSAIQLKLERTQTGYRFLLRANHVGHRVPTGDLFRHFTLEVARGTSKFEVIYSIGRVYGLKIDEESGNAHQNLIEDTSLGPTESRVVLFPFHGPIRYRLVYHYTSERNEFRSLLDQNSLESIIIAGGTQKDEKNP